MKLRKVAIEVGGKPGDCESSEKSVLKGRVANAAKRSGKMNIKNWSAALTRISMETFKRVVSGKM